MTEIHLAVDRTHQLEAAIGAPRSPYGYAAERTRSQPYRAWLLSAWRSRRWEWFLRQHPTNMIIAVFGSAWPTAVHVASCESGLRWWVRNPSGANSLFQIIGGPMLPWLNVQMAHRMYLARGWQPWVSSQWCWG